MLIFGNAGNSVVKLVDGESDQISIDCGIQNRLLLNCLLLCFCASILFHSVAGWHVVLRLGRSEPGELMSVWQNLQFGLTHFFCYFSYLKIWIRSQNTVTLILIRYKTLVDNLKHNNSNN